MPDNEGDFIHKEFPKKFAKNDFWSQIKRTVNGKPVSENDIDMIISQIKGNMELQEGSHLLDIGCGNAALASRLFSYIARYTGVDFSAYLLEIANEFFRPGPHVNYVENDALTFIRSFEETKGVDKVLMYGCMSYLSRSDFTSFIEELSQRFKDVNTVFIGNIPDITKAEEFFSNREIEHYEVDNEKTPIGVWWDAEELLQIAASLGFSAETLKMPESFYGHHYRFDMVLRRA